ncbi:MFS transporter [Bacillus suaedaesalsae]|uniref:MFS transporter n=1 Tax=Bacillus suaedaesalsae TaxID=2810349 RepID=A0ABS2DMK6_9BACI|nr:MFS transporter [Bacillus suaedaesalsae]MBM6619587.1 MFS transporter [Bacillus suaedaesalsae]
MNFFQFSSTIQIRLGLQFLMTLANMSVTPFLVIYFSTKLGTSTTAFMFIGVMVASVVGSMLGGPLSDRLGRKTNIVVAELIVTVCFLAAAYVNSPWQTLPYVTFVLFVIIHFFTGLAGPSYSALIIDESNPDNRKAIYTYSYWIGNLAVAFGGMLGAFLFKDYHYYLFIGVSVCSFISLLITIFFIKDRYKESIDQKESHEPQVKVSYKEVFKHRVFVTFAFANLLIICVEEQLTNYIGIRLTTLMEEPKTIVSFLSLKVDGMNMVGILKTENTILVVTLTLFVTYVMKKYKDQTVLILGLFLFFSGYTYISYGSSPLLLMVAMLVATFGELLHIPIRQTLLANMVPDHARGTYMAMFGVASLIGASLAGIVILVSAFLPPALISSLFMGMGFVSMFICFRITNESTKPLQVKTATL